MNTLTNIDTTIDAIKEVSHGRTYYKELVLFVITRSTNGLRYNTIARRSGLRKVFVHDCLTELLREQLIYKNLNGKKLLYCAKK